MGEVTEKLKEKRVDMVNQKIQDAQEIWGIKKFQDTTNKELEKTQKQLNELREDFNKHQSETKDTIKRELWNKDDNTKYKRGVEQRYEKPQKKRIKQKSWK
jgi:F0F1-type ATP synthase membrane subunit b/b'